MASENSNPETATPKLWGLLGILKAVAILSTLVVVQVVAAALIIPSPKDTEQLARDLAHAKTGRDIATESTEQTDEYMATRPEEDLTEILIDQFTITRYNVEADKTVNVDFEVFATVLSEDQSEYESLFESNQNRIREQINLSVRSAEPKALTDPGLGLIKRRILERTNRALGKPLVRDVFITRFNFVQR